MFSRYMRHDFKVKLSQLIFTGSLYVREEASLGIELTRYLVLVRVIIRRAKVIKISSGAKVKRQNM